MPVTGLPLNFTVTVANDAGGQVKAVCWIPTYDVTIPVGRFTEDYISTSNPVVMRASVVVSDDSVIDLSEVSIGYGREVYGDQILPWEEVNLSERFHDVDISTF